MRKRRDRGEMRWNRRRNFGKNSRSDALSRDYWRGEREFTCAQAPWRGYIYGVPEITLETCTDVDQLGAFSFLSLSPFSLKDVSDATQTWEISARREKRTRKMKSYGNVPRRDATNQTNSFPSCCSFAYHDKPLERETLSPLNSISTTSKKKKILKNTI